MNHLPYEFVKIAKKNNLIRLFKNLFILNYVKCLSQV